MLEDILKGINKEFKKELAVKGIGEFKVKRIPFTSPRLNYETYGGIPRGRVTMFAGKESSGKSTTALDIVKNGQDIFYQEWAEEINEIERFIKEKEGVASYKKDITERKERLKYLNTRGPLKVVYFDAEGTIDGEWAKKLGVDVDNVYLVRLHTQTAEIFLDQVMKVTRDTDDVGLVVIDSIAVLVPKLTHGESFEQKSMGGNSKVVTDFVNEVCPVLSEKDIACIIINQARDDFKNPYAEFSIPCGNALKLASSLTMTFQKGSFIDETGTEQKKSFDRPQGNLIWARIQKTKICKPDRRVGYYTLSYDYGVDVVADIVPLAVEYGIINKAGSWYKIIDINTNQALTDEYGQEIKIQGTANLMDYIRQNETIYNYIYTYINNEACGTNQSIDMRIDPELDKQAIINANQEDFDINELSNKDINDETDSLL